MPQETVNATTKVVTTPLGRNENRTRNRANAVQQPEKNLESPFGVQLGLVTYFRPAAGGDAVKTILIPTASLGTIAANGWYREQMTVTKLASGAQVDVSFWALDGSGNPVGSPATASSAINTSAWRGFSNEVYPMFKNYSAMVGNADNAYFAIVPEPAALTLLCLGGLALLRRR